MPKTPTPLAPEAPEQAQTSVVVSSGGAANQHTWRNIRLITGREYKNRVAQRSFIIITIVMMFLLALVACVPTLLLYISSQTNAQTQVAIVNNAGSVANFSAAQLDSYIDSTLNNTGGQGSQTSRKP